MATTTAAAVVLPEPFASIPRENFLFGPSPIQALPRISQALGGKVQVFAKREDCNSGLAYGGNKTRKLEWVFFINIYFLAYYSRSASSIHFIPTQNPKLD